MYKLVNILSVPGWRAALRRHRVAAGVEHAVVLRNLGPVRTVVDIGANRGQFALAARHCFSDARILSFEPLPGPAARWRAVFAGDARATLVEAAVGPQAGEASIHVSARDASSSLLPITTRQSELFPGTAEAGTATIRVLRLADALPAADIAAPALLKLDVQGFELEALARAGHQVTVCTTDRGNPVQERLSHDYFERLYPANVKLRVFPVLHTPMLFSPRMTRWLGKAFQRVDIVHIHGLYRFPPTYAAWQARRQGVPCVITPHGALDPYLYARSSTGRLRLKRLYERCFDLPNLHGAGAIHYTAEEERQRASFLGLRAPGFIVANGLDWARFRSLPARGALRARWRLGEAPMVLFLGRLHFKKGLDLLVPAFDSLRRRLPDARLVIVGPENDDYGRQVRGWVAERGLQAAVHFAGALEGADVVQAYVDADVFALPSYTENFGMTVAEAMACALPVVISDQVNIHAEVSGAGAGLVTPCDAGEVAGALESLLLDADRRRAMGEAGRRLVRERFTWPAIVEQLTAEYQKVIDRHPRAGAGRRALAAVGDTK